MTRFALGLTLAGALAVAIGAQAPAPSGQAPAPKPQPPAPTADPYAGNAAPGTTSFPLAAPAGVDSKAKDTPPPLATNAGKGNPEDANGVRREVAFRRDEEIRGQHADRDRGCHQP